MQDGQQFEVDDGQLTEEILGRAVRIQEEFISNQPEVMRRTAAELGLSEEAVLEARRQVEAERAEKSDALEFAAHRKRQFCGQVAVFGAINALLLGLNIANWEGELWAIYSILGWGLLGILPLAIVTYTKGPRYARDFAEWRRKAADEKERDVPE